ncbi:MAG: TonB family protein [Deltaproteobacteria bacterium]|nr:TonB family protein [Deltaproteobacteria bacterium]
MKKFLSSIGIISVIIFSLSVHAAENKNLYPPDIKSSASDTPLTVVKEVSPIYPVEAQFDNVEGTVALKFVVTKEGKATKAKIVKAVPPGYFEEAAIETIKQYEFKPATRNGKPVDTTVSMQIEFSLKDQYAGYDERSGTPAVLLEIYMAPFPNKLKKDYKEGKVVVKYIVTREGRIMNPTVIESSPPGVFDEYALEAVTHYRYRPATRNGVPVDCVVKSPIEFSVAKTVSLEEAVKEDVYTAVDEGVEYRNKGEYDKAIEAFSKALNISGRYSIAYYCMGIAYMKKGDYVKAMTDFDKSIEMDPDTAIYYQNRGDLYAIQENYQKAIDDYNKAVKLDKSLVDAYFSRGEALRKSNKFKKAIQDYTKVISLDSGNVQAYNNRGYSYNELDDMKNACVDFKNACELGDCGGFEDLQKAGKCSDMSSDPVN